MVLGSAIPYLGTAETYYAKRKSGSFKSVVASATKGNVDNLRIDTTVLKLASGRYNISPNAYDYVIAAIPIVTSNYPNRNMQAMTTAELLRFRNRFGRATYRTFIGKPTFQDHVNNDPYQSKGIVLDSVIKPVKRYSTAKIIILAAFDRTKDSMLSTSILNKERKFHSMGAWVENFTCSICGADANTPTCLHFKPPYGKGNHYQGRLSYQICNGIDFFESSSVVSPADVTAEGADVFPML